MEIVGALEFDRNTAEPYSKTVLFLSDDTSRESVRAITRQVDPRLKIAVLDTDTFGGQQASLSEVFGVLGTFTSEQLWLAHTGDPEFAAGAIAEHDLSGAVVGLISTASATNTTPIRPAALPSGRDFVAVPADNRWAADGHLVDELIVRGAATINSLVRSAQKLEGIRTAMLIEYTEQERMMDIHEIVDHDKVRARVTQNLNILFPKPPLAVGNGWQAVERTGCVATAQTVVIGSSPADAAFDTASVEILVGTLDVDMASVIPQVEAEILQRSMLASGPTIIGANHRGSPNQVSAPEIPPQRRGRHRQTMAS